MYYPKKWPFVALALSLPLLFACQKNLSETDLHADKDTGNNPEMLVATVDVPGRTLAANCFQCHGTNGHAGELKIAGIGASELARKFANMKADGPRENIMNLHAAAYTAEEIQLMGNYFSKQ